MKKWLGLILVGVVFSLTGCGSKLSWDIQTVDMDSQAKGFVFSMALDSNDYPHICYCDWNDYSLKYAKWDGSQWEIESVETGGNFGSYVSLALDSNGYPHIAYFDWLNQDLKYARWDGLDWKISVIDVPGYVGTYLSMALDVQDCAHISYFDWTNQDLKYAQWTGLKWDIQKIDTDGSVGMYSAIALDSKDHPHISYFDYSNSRLKYAKWTGQKWEIQALVSTGKIEGSFSSIALDSKDCPYISYYDYTNLDLKCARWENPGWAVWVVDSEGEVGMHSSIAIDNNDIPYISYYDHTRYALKCAVLEKAKYLDSKWKMFRGIKWKTKTIDSEGDVGAYTSIKIDSKEFPNVAYCDYGWYIVKYAKMYQGEKQLPREEVALTDIYPVTNEVLQPFSPEEISRQSSVPQQVYIIPEANKIKVLGTEGKFRVFMENRGSRDIFNVRLTAISPAFDAVMEPESIAKMVPGERTAFTVKITLKENFEDGQYGMNFKVSCSKKQGSIKR